MAAICTLWLIPTLSSVLKLRTEDYEAFVLVLDKMCEVKGKLWYGIYFLTS